MVGLCWVIIKVCDVVLGDLSSLAIILLRKRELAVCIMCLFLAVPWVGLRTVIVVFSGDTWFLQSCYFLNSNCLSDNS